MYLKNKKNSISLRVSDSLLNDLNNISYKCNMDLSKIITFALEEFVRRMKVNEHNMRS